MNETRNLRPIKENYGPAARDADLEYLQWKLDHAAGMRIAIKRLVDALERDQVSLGKRSYAKLNELMEASDAFQNYAP